MTAAGGTLAAVLNRRVMESTERSIVPRRVAGVSAALAGTGAVLGAGLSAGLSALGAVILRTAGVAFPGGSLLTAAAVGAGLGALLTPMSALSLLRQVTLGRALLVTILGMSAGVAGGQLATGQTTLAAATGVVVFVGAALLLRLTSGRARSGVTEKQAKRNG